MNHTSTTAEGMRSGRGGYNARPILHGIDWYDVLVTGIHRIHILKGGTK
jgi:hypothetical protein